MSRRVKWGILSLCPLLLILLSSCAAPVIEPTESRVLTLCLEPGAGRIAADTAEMLAERLSTLSDGSLTLEIWQDEQVLDAMLRAGYDLYLITNPTAAEGLDDYAMFSSPYFFEDYDHLSMALGSKRLRGHLTLRTSAALGVEPIAAFYGGSRVFVQAGDTPAAGFDELYEREPLIAATHLGILERMLPKAKTADRGRLIDDFARRRTKLIDIKLSCLDEIIYPEGVESIYLVRDFHEADINWLMLATEGAADTEALTEHESALLLEAASYAIAYHDGRAADLERQQTEAFSLRFGEGSIVSGTRLPGEFRAAMRAEPRYHNLWSWETYDALRAVGLGE